MQRLFRLISGVVCLFIVSGCNEQTLLYDLSQPQVQEVVAALHRNNISVTVDRAEGSAEKFSILVSGSRFTAAHALLQAEGLPRPRELTLAELVEPAGLLPQPKRLEALRYDRALALELKELLKALPMVVSAEVVVRSGTDERDRHQAGASVVLQVVAEDATLRSRVIEIVKRVVPQLQADQVGLEITEVGMRTSPESQQINRERLVPFFWLAHVPEGEYAPLSVVLSICILGVALAGGVVGYWWRAVQQHKPVIVEEEETRTRRTKLGSKRRLMEIEDAGA
jgi:type III secretory pathway lipoprotein EscJ